LHEVSLVHALFDQADSAILPHRARDVQKLTVRIGELAGVETELFRTAFEGCREERGFSSASLEIVFERAAWACTACGGAVVAGGPLRCAACDAPAKLSAGGDLILDRVELEVVDV